MVARLQVITKSDELCYKFSLGNKKLLGYQWKSEFVKLFEELEFI